MMNKTRQSSLISVASCFFNFYLAAVKNTAIFFKSFVGFHCRLCQWKSCATNNLFSYPNDEALKRHCKTDERALSIDDSIDSLSEDISLNLSFQQNEQGVDLPSDGLQNPWNSKVMEDAWEKIKSNQPVSSECDFNVFDLILMQKLYNNESACFLSTYLQQCLCCLCVVFILKISFWL